MRKLIILIIIVVLILAATSPLLAATKPWLTQSGNYLVQEGRTLKRDLIFSGEELEVNGVIEGDLIVFANKVKINGTINGSVIGIITEKLTINGTIDRDLRVIAGVIEVEGAIAKSVTSIAYVIETKPESSLKNGLLCFSNSSSLMGSVLGPVQLTATATNTIGSNIDGDVIIHGASIEWLKEAKVTGNVDDYTNTGQAGSSVKVNVAGEYRNHYQVEYAAEVFRMLLVVSLIMFVGNLLSSLIFNRLFPWTAWTISSPSISNFRKCLFTGLVSSILIPLIIIGLFFTKVGIPLAILLGLIYIIVLFFSGIILNLWFGRLICAKSILNNPKYSVLLIIIGGLASVVIGVIPFLGYFLNIVGFGMVFGNIKPQINKGLQKDLIV